MRNCRAEHLITVTTSLSSQLTYAGGVCHRSEGVHAPHHSGQLVDTERPADQGARVTQPSEPLSGTLLAGGDLHLHQVHPALGLGRAVLRVTQDTRTARPGDSESGAALVQDV